MAKARSKSPKITGKVSGKKQPVALAAPASDSECITYRFDLIDHEGPWPLAGAADELAEVLRKLAQFESVKFEELSGRRGAKLIPLANLAARAQSRLLEIALDDVPGLWELHLDGKGRVWGHREGSVMHIVWWDPQHQVCPSKKRNT